MTPDPGAIRDACMSNISRALWDVDLEQEDMPGALDSAGVGRLAQLLRGALIPIVDAPADRPSAPKGCCSATAGRRRVAALAIVRGLLGTASVAAGAAQDVSLRGRVSDAGGEPLVGVAVTAVATDVADNPGGDIGKDDHGCGRRVRARARGRHLGGQRRAGRASRRSNGATLASRRGSPVSWT